MSLFEEISPFSSWLWLAASHLEDWHPSVLASTACALRSWPCATVMGSVIAVITRKNAFSQLMVMPPSLPEKVRGEVWQPTLSYGASSLSSVHEDMVRHLYGS